MQRRLYLTAILIVHFAFSTMVSAQHTMSMPMNQHEICKPLSYRPSPARMLETNRMLDKINGSPVKMTGDRYWRMRQAMDGYNASHVPLVSLDHGEFSAAGCSDDPGIFMTVPVLMRSFHLPFPVVLAGLLVVFPAISFLFGMILILQTLHGTWPMVFCISGFLALAGLCWWIGDIYPLQAAAVMITIPWLLRMQQWQKMGLLHYVSFFFMGTVAGGIQLFRSHAGDAIALFVAVFLWLHPSPTRRVKVVALIVLLVGLIIPRIVLNKTITTRDSFLESKGGYYEKGSTGHGFWHAIHTGLGFVQNPYVPTVLDEVSAEKAAMIAPDVVYYSQAYENVLRQETLDIVLHHPWILIENVAVKALLTGLQILVFGNIGLFAAFRQRQPIWITIPFWLAIGYSSLFGLIVKPFPHYLLGMAAFVFLYSIISLDKYFQNEDRRIKDGQPVASDH